MKKNTDGLIFCRLIRLEMNYKTIKNIQYDKTYKIPEKIHDKLQCYTVDNGDYKIDP